jgi:sigma-B regulation protein RsbU (phosphoserine phosphatase)
MNPSATGQPSTDRLALLYNLSQQLNSSLDLDEVLNKLMDEVIAALHAERGFIMLRAVEGGLEFRVARGMNQTDIEDPEFQISRSVVDKTAESGQGILTSDAQLDARFNMRQSIMAKGLRAILCVPIKIKDQQIGIIYVDNRLRAGIFTTDDLDLLNSIASSAAIAIENARLYQMAIENSRMETEMKLARNVQISLLPRQTPSLPGWEFGAHWQPARQVGGDYYDFINQSGGKLGIVIADVTDKGMPAALFMASAKNILRASIQACDSIAEGITRANGLIEQESNGQMYISLVYACLDPASGTLNYVNAGHNPPLHLHAKTTTFSTFNKSGMWLGVDANSDFTDEFDTIAQGDLVVFYTDGVSEAENKKGDSFGEEGLKSVVLKNRGKTPQALCKQVIEAVQEFTGSSDLADDITLVIFKRGKNG